MNIICTGYAEPTHWASPAAKRKGLVGPAVAPPSLPLSIASPIYHQHTDFKQGPPALFDQSVHSSTFDPGVVPVDAFCSDALFYASSSSPMAGFEGAAFSNISEEMTSAWNTDWNQCTDMEYFIPAELPYLLNGVERDIHHRMFCHFVQSMSRVLVPSLGDSNPLISEIVPLALYDEIVMDAIMCLAGSHLLKLLSDTDEMRKETVRLHRKVSMEQSRRSQSLHNNASLNRCSVAMQDTVLAGYLLLCLYEICEGNNDVTWQSHLHHAGQILMLCPRSYGPKLNDSDPDTILTDINPFLVEFYIYHDSLATVTSPTPGASKPRFRVVKKEDNRRLAMTGVYDGLCEFVMQISAVRAQADASPVMPNGAVAARAEAIWGSLRLWKPEDTLTKEAKLAGVLYQRALFIWLFSIVYPESKRNNKVQGMVRKSFVSINESWSEDGIMCCLLLPVFILGTAASEFEDRNAIRNHFRRLKDWSSLGNIDLAQNVVEKTWEDYDHGVPNSWDWVKQLESRKMNLLVT